ncbi:MAG: LysR family transcriptional regulator substrate-binding protein [Planctomycetota bacterium]|jgi:DNA-binding transcriptional LysR family regulator
MDVYEFEDEPLVLACSPKHPLSRESRVDIHQLQFERFIGFEKDTPTRIWIDNIFERYNIVLRPAMEFDNVETIKRAVEINSGISILPQTVILQEERYNIVLRPAMEFDNVETIKRAVEINSGISILPQTVILQEVNDGSIMTVGFSNEDFIRPTGIIVRKSKLLGQTGRYFIELLCKNT